MSCVFYFVWKGRNKGFKTGKGGMHRKRLKSTGLANCYLLRARSMTLSVLEKGRNEVASIELQPDQKLKRVHSQCEAVICVYHK